MTDAVVRCGNCRNLCDCRLVFDFLGNLFEFFDCGFGCELNAFFQNHGVCARGNVFQTVFDDCLCKDRSSSGAVARHVVGLGGHFADNLCAHVFKRVFNLNFFCDSHTVVGDEGSTVRFVENDVSSLGTESDFNCICKSIDACFESSSCVVAVFELFSHNINTSD